MKRSSLSLLLASTLLLAACESEIDNKTAAQVKDVPAQQAAPPQAEPAPPAQQPAADTVAMAFSNEGSKLEFVGAKVTKDHPGGFNSFSGTAQVAGDQVVSTTVEIDLSSVFTDAEKLTNHLKSADFFDVEKYAKATFTSTAITAGGEGGTHTVTGILDFNGQKKEVSFPATISVANGAGTVKAEFTIDRQVWGLSYPGKPDDLIKDQVLIKLDINLAPKAA